MFALPKVDTETCRTVSCERRNDVRRRRTERSVPRAAADVAAVDDEAIGR